MANIQLLADLKEAEDAIFGSGDMGSCISPGKIRAAKATKSTYPPLRQTPKRPTLEDLDKQ